MKYGIREICNVVLRAKDAVKLGTKQFYKDEPVIYFDTLKTSSLEGSSSTVYAQGGRGNNRLIAWDGDKTTTFTMEDALISPEGLMILAGAKLLDASEMKSGVVQHMNLIIDGKIDESGEIELKDYEGNVYEAYTGDEKRDSIYVMLMKDGEIVSEPYIATVGSSASIIKIGDIEAEDRADMIKGGAEYTVVSAIAEQDYDSVMVDFYIQHTAEGVTQVEITPDAFNCNFYLEAQTLFRNEKGTDVPAEFVIPNCKVQSNFNFSMAASGDPSTFTFTMDCFPDYTRWDRSHKVLCALQIIPADAGESKVRTQTDADDKGAAVTSEVTVKDADETPVAGAVIYCEGAQFKTNSDGKAIVKASSEDADIILIKVPSKYALPDDPSAKATAQVSFEVEAKPQG